MKNSVTPEMEKALANIILNTFEGMYPDWIERLLASKVVRLNTGRGVRFLLGRKHFETVWDLVVELVLDEIFLQSTSLSTKALLNEASILARINACAIHQQLTGKWYRCDRWNHELWGMRETLLHFLREAAVPITGPEAREATQNIATEAARLAFNKFFDRLLNQTESGDAVGSPTAPVPAAT